MFFAVEKDEQPLPLISGFFAPDRRGENGQRHMIL